MKATLEFNLPEQQEEFDNVVKGGDMKFVIWKFDQYLRGEIKYADDMTSDEVIDTYQKVRDELWKTADEMNININP